MYFQFSTTSHEGLDTEVVGSVDKIIAVEVNADGGTIVFEGGLMFKCSDTAAKALQNKMLEIRS